MKSKILRAVITVLLAALALTVTPMAAASPPSLETDSAYPANRYFYCQLDESIRFLYDALDDPSNFERLKRGEAITVSPPFSIHIPSNATQEEYNTLFDTFQQESQRLNTLLEQLPNAAAAFDRDRSDIFWINGVSGAVSIYENGTAVNGGVTLSVGNTYALSLEITLPLSPDWDGKDADDRVLEEDIACLEASVSSLAAAALSVSSIRYEQLLYLNDQLCKYNDYHTQAAGGNFPLHYPWTPISALDQLTEENDKNGGLMPVCEGYARAFKLVCDRLQIPCVLVSGMGNQEKHMWNYVQMENGYWYAVDVTWNDNAVSNRYFLVGKNTMNQKHTVTNQIMTVGQSASFCTPVLSQTAYRYQSLMLTASQLSPMGTDTVTLTANGVPNGKTVTLTCSDPRVTVESTDTYTWTVRFPNQTATHVFTLTVAGSMQRAECAVQVTHQHLEISLEPDSDTHHKQICGACGKSESFLHDYPDPPVKTEATCTEAGALIKECTCGYQSKQIIPPTGHSYDGDSDDVCNTCGAKRNEGTTDTPASPSSPNGGKCNVLSPLLGGCFSAASVSALPLTLLLSVFLLKKRRK